jgi:hypothetical protein
MREDGHEVIKDYLFMTRRTKVIREIRELRRILRRG